MFTTEMNQVGGMI